MTATNKPDVLVEVYDVPARKELVWTDQMLFDQYADLTRREALARESRQETLSLVLCGQMALVGRLRALVHRRFWVLHGSGPTKAE
jgi:hypothetical protein